MVNKLLPYQTDHWRVPDEHAAAAVAALNAVDTSPFEWSTSVTDAAAQFGDRYDVVSVALLRFGWVNQYGPQPPQPGDEPYGFELTGIWGDFIDADETEAMLTALVPFVERPDYARIVVGDRYGYPGQPDFAFKIVDGAVVRDHTITADVSYY